MFDCNRFKCPTKLVNDFTPDQFEEMVTIFRKFDLDNSMTIDLTEIVKMLEELDMVHTAPQALQLLEAIDKDDSGEIDFEEFCELFSRLIRGDKELRGFDKLTEILNETPISSNTFSNFILSFLFSSYLLQR
jgi:Ca2+-binding EF-hand superfamily protein